MRVGIGFDLTKAGDFRIDRDQAKRRARPMNLSMEIPRL
jgi:hypothetical protein